MSDWPYSYEILDVEDLIVDESYQRSLTTLVNRIIGKFDPALVGTLVVSRRTTGQQAIVDGQTRAAAIRTLAARNEMDGKVPCLVYTGLSRSDEASLFARLQKERRGISSFHRFRAAVVAGEEEAVAIQKLVNAAGYEIGVEKATMIGAVAALERVYRRGPKILSRTFAVLREAWGEQYIPSGDLLRGVGRLLDTDESVNDKALAERLRPLTPSYLKRLALEVSEGEGRGGGGMERHMADALSAVYFGYQSEVGQRQGGSRTCKAKECLLMAWPGEEYCSEHKAKAVEVRRRLEAVA